MHYNSQDENKTRSEQKVILDAIYTLENEGYAATLEGLALLLEGDKRTKELSFSSSYSYLSSISKRKIKNRVHYLINHGYIFLEYDYSNDLQFLRLTPKNLDLDLRLLKKKDIKVKEEIYFKKI